jgi:hypothetical protein
MYSCSHMHNFMDYHIQHNIIVIIVIIVVGGVINIIHYVGMCGSI